MSATIRLVEGRDADQISAIYRHFVLDTPVSFESDPPDGEETAKRIEGIRHQYPWLVCDAEGQVAGYAHASQHRTRFHYQWSVDVTVYVHEEFRRRRIGYALYTSLLAMLPLQGFVMAYAGITLPNAGSVGLHEAMGFRQMALYKNVGYKLGHWHDVGWWQMELCELPREPTNPILLEAARSNPEWHTALAKGQAYLNEGV